MFTRPVLAFYTALCLLFSLLAIPQGPTLVCQMTGKPMNPVAATSIEAQGSCCDVATSIGSDGATKYTLTHPGCCDLIQGNDRADVPAVTTAPTDNPAVAILPESPAAPLAPLTEPVRQTQAPRESAPRAPPYRSSASPRAPPFFS